MRIICNLANLMPSSSDSVLETLFFWSIVSAGLSSLTITFVSCIVINQNVQILFPIGLQIAYFLFTGVAYCIASRKDIRKAVCEPKVWKVRLLRIFVVLAMLLYTMSFMGYILYPARERLTSKVIVTILSIDLKVTDVTYWAQLTALCKFVSLLIDMEMHVQKRKFYKIALICFLLIGFSSLTIIVLALDNIYRIVTLRLLELSFLFLSNIIFSIIAGIQREVFTPHSAAECV